MGGAPYGRRQETHGAPSAAVRAGGGDALSAPLATRSLLSGAIDYAGLFPPASLNMEQAVLEYDRHRRAPDSWALGRFVVPIARWGELDGCVRDRTATGEIWPVSLLAAPTDIERIRDLGTLDRSRLVLQAVECRASSPADVANVMKLARPGTELFVEVDLAADLDAIAAELKRLGASAKIRTGGVTPEAIPSAQQVLAFLRACQRARVRFKATAGLHHAIRGEYHLTYDAAPATGTMFGYLNVAMAAALLWFNRADDVLLAVLEERAPDSFVFTDNDVTWRNEKLSRRELDEVRSTFFVGFGSCSFSEPLTEIGLEALPRS